MVDPTLLDLATGLGNRRGLLAALRERMPTHTGALVLIDLDDFKRVNDVYSHATGDHVLSSRLENRSGRDRDVFVTTPDGVTRKVGRLAPGERARVTAVPGFPGGGLFIFDRE